MVNELKHMIQGVSNIAPQLQTAKQNRVRALSSVSTRYGFL